MNRKNIEDLVAMLMAIKESHQGMQPDPCADCDEREECEECEASDEDGMSTGPRGIFGRALDDKKYFDRFPEQVHEVLQRDDFDFNTTNEALIRTCVWVAKVEEMLETAGDTMERMMNKLKQVEVREGLRATGFERQVDMLTKMLTKVNSTLEAKLDGQRDRMRNIDDMLTEYNHRTSDAHERINTINARNATQVERTDSLSGRISDLETLVRMPK